METAENQQSCGAPLGKRDPLRERNGSNPKQVVGNSA